MPVADNNAVSYNFEKENSMKIMIITTSWFGGGAESVARESYRYFEKNGHECYYACSRTDAPNDINIIPIGTRFDSYMHALKARLLDGNGFGAKKATIEFVNRIEEIDPDIIVIHNIVCYVLNLQIFFNYIRKSKRKTIWTMHDCWAFTGHCISFSDVNCDNWRHGCGKCKGQHEYPNSLFIDRSRSNLMKKESIIGEISNLILVAPSEWMEKVISNTYLKKYQIHIINNGISLNDFYPQDSDLRLEYGIDDKYLILGVASRWTMRKGLKYIVEMDSIIDHNLYQIVLVGVNKKDTGDLPNSIIQISRTNTVQELAKWYSAADIFINPSVADNYPTVNLEALACGTPVVTFNTGGSWESVGDDYGVLVNDKSAKGLYKGVEECIEKHISKELCSIRAKKFDKECTYEKYLELIQSI